MDETKKEVDLDQPFKADGTPDGDVAPKEEMREVGAEDKVPVEEVEKPKVPYSRFENVSRARREAEAEAEKWRQRATELEEQRFSQPKPAQTGVPEWWTKLYGDNPQSKEAYPVWLEGQQDIVAKAKEEAIRELRGEQEAAERAVQANLKSIDDNLEDLSLSLGRDLTEKEQSELLDIVDEYTPKGDDGRYLGPVIPFDKAWDIYEMKQRAAKAPSRQSRDSVASVISEPTSGQPTPDQQERDKHFRPGAWSGWTSRLPKEQ